MRLLVKHGADPLALRHSDHVVVKGGFKYKTETTTAVMAALGMGGGAPRPARNAWEAPALEAVTVAVELGMNINAAETDGRIALDAANAPDYQSVGRYLTGKGARTGATASTRASKAVP